MARLTARQRNHSNVTANNAHEYFKRAYFLPVFCIAQLDDRFTRQKAAACQLNEFLPTFLNSSKYYDIGLAAAKPYRQFLQDGGPVALKTQYMRWQQIAALGGTKDIP